MPRLRLTDACYREFIKSGEPIKTAFDVRLTIANIYRRGEYEGASIYGLEGVPTEKHFRRVVTQLNNEHLAHGDRDFGAGVYRINEIADLDAENICCLVDRFCYVSHLSAMERYGLTDRIPKVLYVTRPGPKVWRQLANDMVSRDHREYGYFLEGFGKRFTPVRHKFPKIVRDRSVKLFTTKMPGTAINIRGEFVRISTIGQTFADMLLEPDLCGGMRHVLEVWENEVEKYLDPLVDTIDDIDTPILKVRAGFILQEHLGISNEKIENWKRFAQRGGSRRLDPKGDYLPPFSETWMISVNV